VRNDPLGYKVPVSCAVLESPASHGSCTKAGNASYALGCGVSPPLLKKVLQIAMLRFLQYHVHAALVPAPQRLDQRLQTVSTCLHVGLSLTEDFGTRAKTSKVVPVCAS
jgi:hypothetical protein